MAFREPSARSRNDLNVRASPIGRDEEERRYWPNLAPTVLNSQCEQSILADGAQLE